MLLHLFMHILVDSYVCPDWGSILQPWVALCVSLPSCPSQLICMQMWDRPLRLLLPRSVLWPPPCCESSPRCPSLPLLLVWMNSSSLTPWLLDFHTVRFFGSSGWFLFLNLLLSFFWLCKEAQCICVRLHLGRKS